MNWYKLSQIVEPNENYAYTVEETQAMQQQNQEYIKSQSLSIISGLQSSVTVVQQFIQSLGDPMITTFSGKQIKASEELRRFQGEITDLQQSLETRNYLNPVNIKGIKISIGHFKEIGFTGLNDEGDQLEQLRVQMKRINNPYKYR